MGWGVGMLTVMLTCVTCTSDVTSLGWGVGMLTFMFNSHAHLTLRPWVGGVGMSTFMLTCVNGVGWTPRPKVFWSSLVALWRTVWRCKVEKNTAHLKRWALLPLPTGGAAAVVQAGGPHVGLLSANSRTVTEPWNLATLEPWKPGTLVER